MHLTKKIVHAIKFIEFIDKEVALKEATLHVTLTFCNKNYTDNIIFLIH